MTEIARSGNRTRTGIAPHRILSPVLNATNSLGRKDLPLDPPTDEERVGKRLPDLDVVVEAWERLPEAVRVGILAMVRASG